MINERGKSRLYKNKTVNQKGWKTVMKFPRKQGRGLETTKGNSREKSKIKEPFRKTEKQQLQNGDRMTKLSQKLKK